MNKCKVCENEWANQSFGGWAVGARAIKIDGGESWAQRKEFAYDLEATGLLYRKFNKSIFRVKPGSGGEGKTL